MLFPSVIRFVLSLEPCLTKVECDGFVVDLTCVFCSDLLYLDVLWPWIVVLHSQVAPFVDDMHCGFEYFGPVFWR